MSTESILRQEEGKRLTLYRCTAGYQTIGVGYNIDVRGLPDDIVEELFRRDMAQLRKQASQIPEYANLDAVRQGVIERMVFQLGIDGVLAFRKFRQALVRDDWKEAAAQMLDSEWYKNEHGGGTPARAKRESTRMLTGVE